MSLNDSYGSFEPIVPCGDAGDATKMMWWLENGYGY